MAAVISAFEKEGKKFPTIGLKSDEGSKYSFTFGMKKAKLILDNIDDIQKFVEENKEEETAAN